MSEGCLASLVLLILCTIAFLNHWFDRIKIILSFIQEFIQYSPGSATAAAAGHVLACRQPARRRGLCVLMSEDDKILPNFFFLTILCQKIEISAGFGQNYRFWNDQSTALPCLEITTYYLMQRAVLTPYQPLLPLLPSFWSFLCASLQEWGLVVL